jgi:PAS domain S-box-containing protein
MGEVGDEDPVSAPPYDAATDLSDIVMWHRAPSGEMTWFGSVESLLGLAPGTFDGRSETLRAHIHPDDLSRLLAQHEIQRERGGSASGECRILRADGLVHLAQIRNAFFVEGPLAGASVGAIMDVTSMREREQQLARVLERVADAVVGLDRDLRLTYVNPRALALAGNRSDLLGRRLDEVFSFAVGDPLIAAIRRALSEQQPVRIAEQFRPTGGWYDFRIYPDPAGATVFATDVTREHVAAAAEREMLAQLRALTARLQTVREQESERIARELHDELGQELAVLKLDIAWLGHRVADSDPEVASKLSDMTAQIDGLATLVRRLATELRPKALDDLGLAAAIEWQVREFGRRSGLAVNASVPARSLEVDAQASIAMFRALQELLTNVARHAEAASVSVRVYAEGAHVVMEVEDDGRGFSGEPGVATLGLLGIRERLAAVGGDFEIGPARTRGTRARVRVPASRSAERTAPDGTAEPTPSP